MSKTTRFFIVYTIYLLLAVTAYVLFYYTISQKGDETTETNALITEIQEQNKQFKNLSNIVEETKDGREKITDFFVVGEDSFINFLETVEEIGEISGVKAVVGAINEAEGGIESVKVLNLGINFEGEWSNVYHFLVLLESFPLKITLDSLRMNENIKVIPGDEEGEEVEEIKWKGSVRIHTLQLAE